MSAPMEDIPIKGEQHPHLVCVDESEGGFNAFKWAINNIDRNKPLLLVYGVGAPTIPVPNKIMYTRIRGVEGIHSHKFQDHERHVPVMNAYMEECKKYNRTCGFTHFPFRGNSEFGELVCEYSDTKDAESVIIGRRSRQSKMGELKRTFLGSASQAVMNHCERPVALIHGEIHEPQ